MKSRVVPVSVSHERHLHKNHGFQYRFMLFILDLDELDHIDRSSRMFGFNRFRPVSIFDQDFLSPGSSSIKNKLENLLKSKASMELSKGSTILLLTAGRVFGHVFNPVSFYFIYNPENELVCAVAEVNNTFGDKHAYVLEHPENPRSFPVRYRAKKDFHVSPFFDMKGEYVFSLSDVRKELDFTITLIKDGQKALEARLWQAGPGREINDFNLLKTWMFHPLAPNLTYIRILRQATSLYLGKKLPVFSRPEPQSPMTIRTMKQTTKLMDRAAQRLVMANLKKIRRGKLELELPDGEIHVFGGHEPGPFCRMRVKDNRFFRKIIKKEDVGLGEAYTQDMWTTNNLTGLMELLIMNMYRMSYLENWGFVGRSLHNFLLLGRRMIPDNDIKRSHENIRAHYDLSNDFFSRFLDPGMTYSCAVFENLEELKAPGKSISARDLQRAQQRKYDLVARAAGIKPGDHVLEIGCGWGGFAVFASQELECRVHAVTISKKQHEYVQELVRSRGLDNRVRVVLEDYRSLKGQFDALVSIEMLEAVGHKYHPGFFAAVDRLLKPGGLACIQTITIIDQRYEAYRKTQDWISTYIFPGGQLPSLNRITRVLAQNTSLVISDIRDIGHHYGPTLACWRRRFQEKWQEIKAMGFDEDFRRTWEYYFSICEAGFNQRNIRDLQIILDRPKYINQRNTLPS
jgi:cyclopropane-fatty-acyl-phospholipid synthase